MFPFARGAQMYHLAGAATGRRRFNPQREYVTCQLGRTHKQSLHIGRGKSDAARPPWQ